MGDIGWAGAAGQGSFGWIGWCASAERSGPARCPGTRSAEGGAETPEGGLELVPPRPGLVDAQVEVPAPPCEAGGDVEDLVAQCRRLGARQCSVEAQRRRPR